MKLSILLLLLLVTFSCKHRTDSNERKNLIDIIPEDSLMDVSKLQLTDLLQYCDIKVDSFYNDTTYSFSGHIFTGENAAKSTKDIRLITSTVYYFASINTLALRYMFVIEAYKKFDVIKFRVDENRPVSIMADDFSGDQLHLLTAKIIFRKDFELLKQMASTSRVYVRLDNYDELDHLMPINQKNMIRLMLRLIELKKYSIKLI